MTIRSTPYADIDDLLDSLLSQIREALGRKLVGLYLYGSMVSGDFDHEVSDIDLLAVTSSDVDESEFNQLHRMQNDLAIIHKNWEGRLEIVYLSTAALQTFRWRTSQMAVISPGEPFHFKEAGREWLVNWYLVREQSLTLFGPSPQTVIEPITTDEFIQVVREHAEAWKEWVHDGHARKGQSYAILTMCRALYTVRNREWVSKIQAARWTAKRYTQWASLIEDALLWRAAGDDEDVDPAVTFDETLRFVHFAAAQVAAY